MNPKDYFGLVAPEWREAFVKFMTEGLVTKGFKGYLLRDKHSRLAIQSAAWALVLEHPEAACSTLGQLTREKFDVEKIGQAIADLKKAESGRSEKKYRI